MSLNRKRQFWYSTASIQVMRNGPFFFVPNWRTHRSNVWFTAFQWIARLLRFLDHFFIHNYNKLPYVQTSEYSAFSVNSAPCTKMHKICRLSWLIALSQHIRVRSSTWIPTSFFPVRLFSLSRMLTRKLYSTNSSKYDGKHVTRYSHAYSIRMDVDHSSFIEFEFVSVSNSNNRIHLSNASKENETHINRNALGSKP